MEIRKHSYTNKAAILHIDRRKEFKQKLVDKDKPKKDTYRATVYTFEDY